MPGFYLADGNPSQTVLDVLTDGDRIAHILSSKAAELPYAEATLTTLQPRLAAAQETYDNALASGRTR